MTLASIAWRHAVSMSVVLILLVGLPAMAYVAKARAGSHGVADLIPFLVVLATPCAVLWSSLRTLALDAPRHPKIEIVLAASGLAALLCFGAYLVEPAASQRQWQHRNARRGLPAPTEPPVRTMSLPELQQESDALATALSTSTASTFRSTFRLADVRHEIGRRIAVPGLAPLFALVAILLTGRGPGWGRIGSGLIVIAVVAAWVWLDDRGSYFSSPTWAMPLAFAPGLVVLLAAAIVGAILGRRADAAIE